MLIQSYKTSPAYGPIKITLSNYAKAIIKKSVTDKPRKWLFVTKNDTKYSISTPFGTAVSGVLGININQIRRAFVNYYIFVESLGRLKVSRLAKHSIQVNESTYTTTQSNIATQNDLYDEIKLINTKVNVKIAKGANKNKTLVGTVTRSLLPDRKKFPYSIKFNDNDKQTNEKANKIPGTGIILYKEPAPTAQGNKANANGKRNTKGKKNKGNKGNKKNTPPPPTRKKKTPPITTPPPPTNVRSNRNK
jgi:hypothetical protein